MPMSPFRYSPRGPMAWGWANTLPLWPFVPLLVRNEQPDNMCQRLPKSRAVKRQVPLTPVERGSMR